MHPSIQAQNNPDKPAFIMADSGVSVSFKELDDRSNQCAQLLRSLDINPGDHIAMLMENCEHFFEICWAAQRSGVICTPISTHLQGEEIAYSLDNCDAKALFTTPKLQAAAESALEITPDLAHRLLVGGSANGFSEYLALRDEQPAERVADECAGGDMLYSSGTTGKPKGIKVKAADPAIDAMPPLLQALVALFGFNGETMYLSPAPLYHAAPLRFTMLVQRLGGTTVIMEKFDSERALSLIEEYRATHSQWVPIMFVRMLKLDESVRAKYDVSSMQVAIHAAAPCPVEVKQGMIDWWGPVINEYYAASEGHGLTFINSEDWLTHRGSVGRSVTVPPRILDDNGDEVPRGEVGTIYFEPLGSFSYHKAPEKTAESRSKQGWLTVGDVGYLDDEDYLYLTDRKAFMIISGGVNIYPQEVENLLICHDEVADVAVFGVPDEEFGEAVKAVVQPQDWAAQGPELEERLIAHCREQLSHVKCPRSIDFEQELPRYPNGKLYKRLLRDRYWP
jgi:acyl-CoA synthetase (AMP-forming)/AMP-acid ligase II